MTSINGFFCFGVGVSAAGADEDDGNREAEDKSRAGAAVDSTIDAVDNTDVGTLTEESDASDNKEIQ